MRNAADSAVSSDGKIRLEMPESASTDEIGALSRGFERLLARLNEHTLYLRTLGGKLSHELRTPLTIVRSSLDNLESEGVRGDQRGYLTRAREGAVRLQSILAALGAASRVEESIQQAERVSFDLAELARAAVAGYRDAFPDARFVLDCALHGGTFTYCRGTMAHYRIHSKHSLSRRDPAAFIACCFRSAHEVEEWFQEHGGITAKRRGVPYTVAD